MSNIPYKRISVGPEQLKKTLEMIGEGYIFYASRLYEKYNGAQTLMAAALQPTIQKVLDLVNGAPRGEAIPVLFSALATVVAQHRTDGIDQVLDELGIGPGDVKSETPV